MNVNKLKLRYPKIMFTDDRINELLDIYNSSHHIVDKYLNDSKLSYDLKMMKSDDYVVKVFITKLKSTVMKTDNEFYKSINQLSIIEFVNLCNDLENIWTCKYLNI